MGSKGFRLFFNSVITIIKDVYIFFSVINNHKCIKVFKLLAHLNIRAYSAVLPKGLYYYNLSLLKGPSCFKTTAFYKVFIEFLFKSSQNFKRGMVDINKRCK